MKLLIKEITTGKIIKELDVSNKSERTIERIIRGLLHQMNTDKYYIDETKGG